jgi:hypothetical protein
VSVLYFVQFNPFHYFPLSLPSSAPHYSTAFNTYHFILYLHRCNIFWYFYIGLL